MTAVLVLTTAVLTAAVFTRPPDRRPLQYWRHYRRARNYTQLQENLDLEDWLTAMWAVTR